MLGIARVSRGETSCHALLAVACVVALAGCHRAKHVTGHHPVPGVMDGDLKRGAAAFYCDEEERCRFGTVSKVSAQDVYFVWPEYPNAGGFQHPRDRVIPASRLVPGDVMEDIPGDWHLIERVDATGVVAGGMTYAWKVVMIPTDRAEAIDRHARRVSLVGGGLLTLLALGSIVLARFLSRRKSAHVATARMWGKTGALPSAGTDEPPTVLACTSCGTPVALAARPEVTCPGCSAKVTMPPAYLELVRRRDAIASGLPREASALRRARIIGHPLVGLAMLGAAYGAFRGLSVFMRWLFSDASSPDIGFKIVAANPLLYVPLGLVTAGLGQLLGARKLRARVPELAAIRVPSSSSYVCRGCGAPLGETRDGVAELCSYCGAQNLISSRLAASAARAADRETALATSMRAASASFWASMWSLVIPLLYVLGAVGMVLYPIIFAVGLSM